jgi:hypothetical protein
MYYSYGSTNVQQMQAETPPMCHQRLRVPRTPLAFIPPMNQGAFCSIPGKHASMGEESRVSDAVITAPEELYTAFLMRALIPSREKHMAHRLTHTHEPLLPQVKSLSRDPFGAARRTKEIPMK